MRSARRRSWLAAAAMLVVLAGCSGETRIGGLTSRERIACSSFAGIHHVTRTDVAPLPDGDEQWRDAWSYIADRFPEVGADARALETTIPDEVVSARSTELVEAFERATTFLRSLCGEPSTIGEMFETFESLHADN